MVRCRRSAANLNRRIDELLDLARSELDMLRIHPESIDPATLLQEIANETIPVALRRRQSLILEIPPSLPSLQADRDRVRQVILNLLNNAFKFTPDGGKVKIEAGREHEWCRVSVIDNGIGIRREDQERIFEPFCRLDSPLARERTGTGLGLTLVKQIVERHGGRIWVESELDEGSRFTFTAPLATGAQPNPAEKDRP